jgi:hypothetical protein
MISSRPLTRHTAVSALMSYRASWLGQKISVRMDNRAVELGRDEGKGGMDENLKSGVMRIT